jgi:hypothetical protein
MAISQPEPLQREPPRRVKLLAHAPHEPALYLIDHEALVSVTFPPIPAHSTGYAPIARCIDALSMESALAYALGGAGIELDQLEVGAITLPVANHHHHLDVVFTGPHRPCLMRGAMLSSCHQEKVPPEERSVLADATHLGRLAHAEPAN